MSLEFVWIYSPSCKIETDWFAEKTNFHGSLIDKPIKCIKNLIGGHDFSFLLSNKDIEFTSDCLFDGTYVYDKCFGSEYIPKNLDDYFNFIYNARGTFCVAFAYEQANVKVLRFSNDILGMYPILYWTDGENIIVTNNPILAEGVAKESLGINLKRSFLNVANEVIAFSPLDYGPFDDMKFLPFDSELLIDDRGHINIKRKHGDDYFYRSQESEEKLINLAVQELTENVEGIANAPQQIKISDITGGFDSRLVLALILNANVKDKFYFNTNGSFPNPDANVANYIIDKYKLKKIDMLSIPYKRKGKLSSDVLYELSTFSYVASGMKNNIDRHLSSLFSNDEILSVGGGYSAYKANKSKSLIDGGDIKDAVDLICSGNFSLPTDIISHTRGIVEKLVENWVIQQGMSVHDALDRFHIEHRTRFHIGLCEHWSRICQPKMHPLQSPALVRLAFKVGYEARITDKLLFSLMEKLEPSLCLIPFENKIWKEKAYVDSKLKEQIARIEPITFKSKCLYQMEPNKEFVSFKNINIMSKVNIPFTEQNNMFFSSVLKNSDKKWEQEQRKLGRKWHWYKLSEIKSAFDHLLLQTLEKDDQFSWMDSLSKKNLKDFKNIKEVIELHVLTNFLIFYQNKEIPLRVNYR